MKKKLLVLVLSAVMAVGMMSGCGAKSDTSDGEAKVEQEASSKEDKKEETPKCELEDGTYTAEFKTDSGMFHVNEANDGKGTLTVKDGKMTIHVSLPFQTYRKSVCWKSKGCEKRRSRAAGTYHRYGDIQ